MCTVGAYATHILLPAAEVLKLEKDDDPIDMCALPLNYMTAYGLLKRAGAKLEMGSSILIGSVAGGVGTAMAQLVNAFDMGITMYGTCSASKFEYVKTLGVTPIDRRDPDIAARVRELTGGNGVDVAYDAVGSQKSIHAAHESTKEDTGQVICLGMMSRIKPDGSGMLPVDFDVFKYIQEGRVPRASFFAVTHGYYYTQKGIFVQDFQAVAEKVRKRMLKPVIGKLLRLSDAVEVNEMLVSGVGVQGKLEVVVDAQLARAKNV